MPAPLESLSQADKDRISQFRIVESFSAVSNPKTLDVTKSFDVYGCADTAPDDFNPDEALSHDVINQSADSQRERGNVARELVSALAATNGIVIDDASWQKVSGGFEEIVQAIR